MSEDPSRGHVFLSYLHDDSASADLIDHALKSARLQVWRDTANLWPGEDWRSRIRQAITSDALAFLACFSRASLARTAGRHNEELTLAIEQIMKRRPDVPWLIPVRLDDCAIPDLDIGAGRTLTSIQHVDIFGDSCQEGLAVLVTAVRRIFGRSSGVSASDHQRAATLANPDARPGFPPVAGRNMRISATEGGVAAAVIYGNVTISTKPSADPASGDHDD